MRKFLPIMVFALSFSFMSMSSISEFAPNKKPKLITYVCPSGYTFQYYEHPSFTQADYEEMADAVCNDPANN